MNKRTRKQLEDIKLSLIAGDSPENLEYYVDQLESLSSEEREKADNMADAMPGTEQTERLEESASALEEAHSSLEEAKKLLEECIEKIGEAIEA